MGTLYVVATPIGNLEDISIRAIRILLTVPVIACEDTRHTGILIKLLDEKYRSFLNNSPLRPPLNLRGGSERVIYVSVRDWNEAQVVDRILEKLSSHDVALVSDAGTPLISDPGFKVVRAARQAGFTVSPIPGPSAAIAAISVSGLPTDKFIFWGFLPKKWELYPGITNIIYESPKRLQATIAKIQSKYPHAEIVVASELTKIHEQVVKINGEPLTEKGEAVILVNFSPSSQSETGSP